MSGIRIPEGLLVARDLGGLPLVGGGETASGGLLRSSSPHLVQAAGWADLAADGLTTIVDLRDPGEGEPATGVPDGVELLSRPVEVKEADFFATALRGRWPDHGYFADSMREWPELWIAALDAVADAPGAVLVHCFAGRDRTGHLIATILDAAGVERDAIVADYVAGVSGFNATLEADPPRPGHRRGTDLEDLLTMSEGSMAAFLDGVRDPRIAEAAARAGQKLRD